MMTCCEMCNSLLHKVNFKTMYSFIKGNLVNLKYFSDLINVILV